MALQDREDVTKLLNLARQGERDAEERLLEIVYFELKRLARACLRSEDRNQTIQATALVNEVYLRLAGHREKEWRSRTHFMAVAAQAMRRILVDCARARDAKKRGGDVPHVECEPDTAIDDPWSDELLDINAALEKLSLIDARQARVVELRFFAGLTEAEIGQVLGVSDRTVKREWEFARAWLEDELAEYACERRESESTDRTT